MLNKLLSTITALVLATMSISAFDVSCYAKTTKNMKYEAEQATLTDVTVEYGSNYSGGRCVKFKKTGCCSFAVEIPSDGYYDLNFVSSGIGSQKYNYAGVDGSRTGEFYAEKEKLTHSSIKNVYIRKGKHTIEVTPSWGWIMLDYFEITKSDVDTSYIYKVSGELSNPNASKNAKKLMKFICDNYGKKVISGQQCEGMDSAEFKAIKEATGKSPALMGFDLMRYTKSTKRSSERPKSIEKAIEFSNAGGIVTICWHWRAPDKFIKDGNDENGNPRWWGAFYTKNVEGLDLLKIMNDPDSADYKLLVNDIDDIAKELKRLADKDIPVLFRPLHEASGEWFWWGSDGPDAYKKLYKLLYTRLTEVHKLNNLIWVWNGQDAEWYPGDKYVDIIGEDIYPGLHQYGPQNPRFIQASQYTENKVVALTENGCLFDIDEAIESRALWSWFCVWNGDFTAKNGSLSEKYTERYKWKEVYNHEDVITLDDMKKYFKG